MVWGLIILFVVTWVVVVAGEFKSGSHEGWASNDASDDGVNTAGIGLDSAVYSSNHTGAFTSPMSLSSVDDVGDSLELHGQVTYGVNPATGLPMTSESMDAGGNTYGFGNSMDGSSLDDVGDGLGMHGQATYGVNPASGLPMTSESMDAGGNPYGFDNSMDGSSLSGDIGSDMLDHSIGDSLSDPFH